MHDALERIMHDEQDIHELPDVISNSLEQVEMLGLSFPKDRKGNDTIRENWTADMLHFADHFEPPEGMFDTEEFFLYKIDDDHYIQGYIDLIKYDKGDGSEQSIYDWKTSSMYSKAEMKEHANQLLIYAMAKEQAGVKINEIAWYFLKYVTVSFMGKPRMNSKKKTLITKHINRRKLVEELEPYIHADMEERGYSDVDIELALFEALHNNSLDNLPLEIRTNYLVEPCKVTYELNDETREDCRQWIDKMILKFEGRNPDDVDQWEPRPFTKTTKTGREVDDYFFCSALCGHARNCKYLEDFLEQKRLMNEDLEMFL